MQQIIHSDNDVPAELQVLMLRAEMAVLKSEHTRLLNDIDSLPQGWHAKKISDTSIRVDAIDKFGNMCYWILDTVGVV